jgi:hypothetical protein
LQIKHGKFDLQGVYSFASGGDWMEAPFRPTSYFGKITGSRAREPVNYELDDIIWSFKMLQQHYWKEFYRLKVHINYIELMLAKTESTDRGIKIFTAITSSSSIGAWIIWKDYAFIWGVLIAASQVLNAIRQYLPYKERLRSYSGLLNELEEIFLGVESRWLEIANGDCSLASISKALSDLRLRRYKAFKKHLPNTTIPEEREVTNKAEEKALAYFNNFYTEENNYEQFEEAYTTTSTTSKEA